MSSAGGRRIAAIAGTLLATVGSLSGWATVETVTGTVVVDGWDRGGAWLLAGALLAAGVLLAGRALAAVAIAAATAAVSAVALYELPGTLLAEIAGAHVARLSWGAGVALLGVLVLLVAALRGRMPGGRNA